MEECRLPGTWNNSIITMTSVPCTGGVECQVYSRTSPALTSEPSTDLLLTQHADPEEFTTLSDQSWSVSPVQNNNASVQASSWGETELGGPCYSAPRSRPSSPPSPATSGTPARATTPAFTWTCTTPPQHMELVDLTHQSTVRHATQVPTNQDCPNTAGTHKRGSIFRKPNSRGPAKQARNGEQSLSLRTPTSCSPNITELTTTTMSLDSMTT